MKKNSGWINTDNYKGHVIRESVEFGWSDSQQRMVENGIRLEISGPHYNLNRQTYIGVGHEHYKAIDLAIANSKDDI